MAPVGIEKLDEAPDRMDFEVGTAAGAAAFSAAMVEYVEKNFDSAGSEARTADAHELSAGFFGYPHLAAAECAVDAIHLWLTTHVQQAASLERIVFDVFTQEDAQAVQRRRS